MTKTLKNFLKKHEACEDLYLFAQDLTLEEFLDTCHRGDWMLWLFKEVNPDLLRELTLAKGHCANTVRHLMRDEYSIKAVDTAIAFGEGKATMHELNDVHSCAYTATTAFYGASYSPSSDAALAAASDTAFYASTAYAYAASHAAAAAKSALASAYAAWAPAAAYATASARENKKQTADICRNYLPIEIWNQSLIESS